MAGVRRIYANPAKLQRSYLIISVLVIAITTVAVVRQSAENLAVALSLELAVLSLIFAIGSAYRPKSRVVFIYKSKSYFSDEIVKGLQQAFSSRPDFELVNEEATEPQEQSFEQRLNTAVYKHIFSPRLAAIIIRPSDISDRTHEIISSILKLGVAVVVIDYDIGEKFDRLIDDNQPVSRNQKRAAGNSQSWFDQAYALAGEVEKGGRRMKARRGLARFGLVLIPYMAWWGWRGLTAERSQNQFQDLRSQAMNAGDLQSESAYFYAAREAGEIVQQSFLWGLYIPLSLPIWQLRAER